MGAIASQITSLTIVYSNVYNLFRRRWKKTSKLRVTGLCVGISPGTGEFPAQMASNAENVSIWWRHHADDRWTPTRHITKASNVELLLSISRRHHAIWFSRGHGDGLVQERRNSIANALELRLSCTSPSMDLFIYITDGEYERTPFQSYIIQDWIATGSKPG